MVFLGKKVYGIFEISHILYIYFNHELKSGNLAEFGDEYFEATEDGDIKEVEKRRSNLERYKKVLNSKSNEEALVGTLASLL